MMLNGQYQFLKGYQNNHVTIGFGSYGQVKLARKKFSGQMVAIKIINKLAKNQIIFHTKLSHPNIIQLLDHQIDPIHQTTYMVLQFADSGTLFQSIKTSFLPKSIIKSYFHSICLAINYLHSKQIMHRDIKPENILLSKKGGVKLCDFGFAALCGERKTLCGTYQYMSPEMIQNRPYDVKIDVWALGILLFQMISGHAPFRGESPQQVLEQMKTKIYFCQRFEAEQINLIKIILRVTPHKRPTVQQILQNPYFNQDSKTALIQDSTSISQVKKLNSMSSNSSLQQTKLQNQIQQGHFYKKCQKPQQTKPHNSYPFYFPKAKFTTNGSTSSSGTNPTQTSSRLLMPQTYQNSKAQPINKVSSNQLQSKTQTFNPLSPFKVHQTIDINGLLKYKTSPLEKSGLQQTLTSISSVKGLNYTMSNNFKNKFSSLHGEYMDKINHKDINHKDINHIKDHNKDIKDHNKDIKDYINNHNHKDHLDQNKDHKDIKNKQTKLIWQKNHTLTNINKQNDSYNPNNNTFSNINRTNDQYSSYNTIDGATRNDRGELKITSPNTKTVNKTYAYQPKFNLQDIKRQT